MALLRKGQTQLALEGDVSVPLSFGKMPTDVLLHYFRLGMSSFYILWLLYHWHNNHKKETKPFLKTFQKHRGTLASPSNANWVCPFLSSVMRDR